MRIGIFGGSFDPIHQGHLILAEQCRISADLDQVWFVPAATSPLKQDGPKATNRQRKEMVELAIAGHEPFRCSSIELDRGGVSFTVDTLTTFAETYPDDDLFLLMGDDSLESFAKWKEPATICQLATLLVVNRPGCGEVNWEPVQDFCQPERLEEMRRIQLTCPLIEISSTAIRESIKKGISIRYQLPRSVERYLQTQKLYNGDLGQ